MKNTLSKILAVTTILAFVYTMTGNTAHASTGYIDVNGDVTGTFLDPLFSSSVSTPGWDNSTDGYCGAMSNNHTFIDVSSTGKNVRQPSAPSTGTYITYSGNDSCGSAGDTYNLTTISSVSSVSSVTIWVYGNADFGSHNVYADLVINGTQQGGQLIMPGGSGTGWYSVTFSGLSASQSDLDSMQVFLWSFVSGGGSASVYGLYAEVTYTASGGGGGGSSPSIIKHSMFLSM